jgi:RNA polymerase sigma-70 factor (ECF subfamily)
MASIRANSTASAFDVLFREGSLTGLSDEQLIELFVSERDRAAEHAFEALIQRHGPMVLGVCVYALGDLHDAEDAFQATFLVLARRAASLRVPARLGSWLLGVARRSARKVRARRIRVDRLTRRAEGGAEIGAAIATHQDIHREEEARVLHDEIGRLPERYRTPVVLCYFEGLTHAEAARRLGWPIGTVGVRLMRARERLRSRLTRRGLGPSLTALLPCIPLTDPLSPSLSLHTARAAVGFAAKSGSAAGAIPSAVAPIAIDVLRKMAITNAARVLAAVLLVGLVAAGSAALAFPAKSRRPKAPDPPSASQKRSPRSDAVKSILSNGGFEHGNPEGNSPESWETGAEVDGVDYLWDRTVAHGERASLHLKKTAKRYFPIAQWSQEVKRTGTMPRLKVSAFVRATKMTKAVLDVQFINRDGSQTHQWAAYIGAKQASSPPVTHDWKKYEGVVKIPDGTEKLIVAAQIYGPGDVWFDDAVAVYTNAQPTDPLGLAPSKPAAENPESDVALVPIEERKAGNDPRKRYLLIGPTAGTVVSPEGYKLLLVLPGGDGSAEFRWFARRIAKNSLPRGYLVAELVAVSWTPEQFKQVVWPTAASEISQVGFTTEEFVDAVITDLAQSKTIDPRYVFTLGWSSGGPPVYATSLSTGTQVTGSFVAMSVFKEGRLPALGNARGRAYYLYHSPQDQLCPFHMAEDAARKLAANGASVKLATYQGGHGWVGPVYEDIRSGIAWLEKAHASPERDRFRTNQPIAARQTRAAYRGSGAGISTSESIVPE